MHESFESNESQPVKLTAEEFDLISKYSFPETDEEKDRIKTVLSEKSINVDSGNLVVEVDGIKHTITTNSRDFGTILIEDQAA